MRQRTLLDQVWAVVDGGPVQESDVLFVWLPDIISCLHQLLTALEDTEPGGSTRTKHSDNDRVAAAFTLTHTERNLRSVQAHLHTSLSKQTAAACSQLSWSTLTGLCSKRQKSDHPLPANYLHIPWLMLTVVQIYWSNTCQCQNAHSRVSYLCTTEQIVWSVFTCCEVKLSDPVYWHKLWFDVYWNIYSFGKGEVWGQRGSVWLHNTLPDDTIISIKCTHHKNILQVNAQERLSVAEEAQHQLSHHLLCGLHYVPAAAVVHVRPFLLAEVHYLLWALGKSRHEGMRRSRPVTVRVTRVSMVTTVTHVAVTLQHKQHANTGLVQSKSKKEH